jgi:hypothetical protein
MTRNYVQPAGKLVDDAAFCSTPDCIAITNSVFSRDDGTPHVKLLAEKTAAKEARPLGAINLTFLCDHAVAAA